MAAQALGEALPGVHSYTLELSFFCAAQGNVRGEAYTPQSYTDMGADLGMALHEHFSWPRNGAIAVGPAAAAAAAAAARDAATAAALVTPPPPLPPPPPPRPLSPPLPPPPSRPHSSPTPRRTTSRPPTLAVEDRRAVLSRPQQAVPPPILDARRKSG